MSLPYPVYTKKDGIVSAVRWDNSLGKIVSVKFRTRRFWKVRDYEAVHGFMDAVIVRPGLHVRRGTVLGYRRDAINPLTVRNRRGKVVKTHVYKGKVKN